MRRRDFLAQAVAAAVPALLPLNAFGPQASRSEPSREIARLTSELEQRVPEWLREARVPGISIAIIENARISWRRGFGVKDADARVPVDIGTMFEAASMSKPIFAYVVLKLTETGVLNLDTPLTKYTSSRFLAGDARLDRITARHVLSHTSGFQNWRSDEKPLAIHFEPGSQYLYSGEGYNYLQAIVTELLQQSFEIYMRRRLFDPFGMPASGYVWDDGMGRRVARPHAADGKPIAQNKSDSADVARYGSAGSLKSTPSDYAAFVISLIAPSPADQFRLGSATLKEMLRPHVKVSDEPNRSSWALGWQIFHNPKRDFIFHGGNNKGFHSNAVASVAGRSGYVAMTNGDGGPKVLTQLLTFDPMQTFLNA